MMPVQQEAGQEALQVQQNKKVKPGLTEKHIVGILISMKSVFPTGKIQMLTGPGKRQGNSSFSRAQ
jgi:hypothetical protein